MSEFSNPPIDRSTNAEGDEISLLDLLIVLAKHKKLVLGLPFATALIASMLSLQAPDIYTGTTTLLPPQQSSSAGSAVAAQLSGLAQLVGAGEGIKGTNDIYVAILKSRRIADKIIQRFGLVQIFEIDSKHPSDVYRALAGMTKIGAERDGTITIDVDDKDPKLAAELANAYVDELTKLNQTMALTEASQRRLFFERQFAQAKENLANAEAAARQALQTGGLIKVDAQGIAMAQAAARLRGEISAKEVSIGAMRAYATDRNPNLLFAQREVESMKRELAKIEGAGGSGVAGKETGDQGTESVRRLRDVKYYEVIFDQLAKQYELAKIEEAKGSSVIQVLDKAIVPDRKSKPFRSRIVLTYTFGALFISIVLAFILDAMAKARSDPQKAERMRDLSRYLAWRKIA